MFQLRPQQITYNGLSAKFLPPGLSLAVVHHQVTETQEARSAEVQDLSVHRPPVHEGGIAEGSIRDDYRFASYNIVDDLVPYHNL